MSTTYTTTTSTRAGSMFAPRSNVSYTTRTGGYDMYNTYSTGPSIVLDSLITGDDVISTNEAAAGNVVSITGRVGGSARAGDQVVISVNNKQFGGYVNADGTFSVGVYGSDLAADATRRIKATVYSYDNYGNQLSAVAYDAYRVNTTTGIAPTITLDTNITGDDVITASEAAAGNVVLITGRVGGGAKVGDEVVIEVNNKLFGGRVKADRTFTVGVYGSDLAADADRTLEATITTTDAYGNELTATVTDTYRVNTQVTAVRPTITLDSNITADDIISADESTAGKVIGITGTVTNAKAGDQVVVSVNNKLFGGRVNSDGRTFTVGVYGSDLAADADRTIEATITTLDSLGNELTATDSETYRVGNTAPVAPVQPTITLESNITADDMISLAEAKGNVSIKGTVGGSAKAGDSVILTINNQQYQGTVARDNSFLISVKGSDLAADADRTIEALVRTSTGLTATDTETYRVETAPVAPTTPTTPTQPTNPVTPTTPSTNQDATITFNKITSDNLLNWDEAKGNITLTGSVGGTAKAGDKITINVNNRTYQATVDSKKNFSVSIAGSELAADADHKFTATLQTKDKSGKALTVNGEHSYGAIRQVSGANVGDTGQSQAAYFIRSIATDSRSGYLAAPNPRWGGNGRWEGLGKGITVSYSFATAAHGGERGFKEYSETQKNAVRSALNEYETFADITFREVEDGQGDFRFFLDDLRSAGARRQVTSQNMCTCCGGFHQERQPAAASADGTPQFLSVTTGYAYYGGDVHINGELYSGDTSLNSTTNRVFWNGAFWDSGYGTVVHEIGHSLGLKHTGNYNGSNGSAAGPYLPTGEENTGHSIMSYNDSDNMTGKGLQIFDLAAIHYRYGVNHNQRSGNDTYTFKPFDQSVVGNNIYIWDGAGVDTFDASAENQGVTVDLTPGSWIHSGAKTTNLVTNANGTRTRGQAFIGYDTQIENLIGSAHNDNLKGNKADNVILGGAGNDRIDGGAGNDQLDGGAGDDTYVFSGRGFGQDVILGTGGGNDTIAFENVAYNSVMSNGNIVRQGNDLVLKVAGTTDSVTVKEWFNGNTSIQTVTFSSGQRVSASTINSMVGAASNMVNAMAAFGTAAVASNSISSQANNQPNMMLAASALAA